VRRSDEVLLVAGMARREVSRRPGAWVSTLLTGTLFAGLLLLVGMASGALQAVAENRVYLIAVGGDLEGGRTLLADLAASDRYRFVERADPQVEVTEKRAAAGLILPPGADAALADGEPVELFLSYRAAQASSTEALILMQDQIQRVELAAFGVDPDDAHLRLDVTSVLRDERIGRVQISRQIGAVAALLCLGVVSSVAGVFGATREHRALEPLLALPLARRSLSAGVAVGVAPIAGLQVMAGVVLLVLAAAVPISSFAQPIGTLAAMLAGGIPAAMLLTAVACAMGSVAGSLGTGTDDAVSLGDLLALPFVVAGILLFTQQDVAASLWACAVPIYGQALLVREAVAGTASAAQVVVAATSAAVTATVLVRIAGHLIDNERRLLRATR